jgi:hypothetical protein
MPDFWKRLNDEELRKDIEYFRFFKTTYPATYGTWGLGHLETLESEERTRKLKIRK